MLANLQQEFHTMLDARQSQAKPVPRIYCFFEELPFNNIVGDVVPRHSAILTRCGNQPIHANHVDMTKFADRKDQGYQNISGQLRVWNAEKIESEAAGPAHARQPNLEEIRTNRGKKFGDGRGFEGSHVYTGPVYSDGGQLIQGNLTSSGDIDLNHVRDLSFKRV